MKTVTSRFKIWRMLAAATLALALVPQARAQSEISSFAFVQQDGTLKVAGNTDLSAWMLQQGWALALSDAPFEYSTLEKIARAKGVGVWGIAVDTLRREHR